tara:strand:+ start:57 stop:878 length:822 start_codon:yes stop_codon:yes gene_type:complete
MNKIQDFKELMFLKNFSEKTIKAYASSVSGVAISIAKQPEDITEEDIREFLLKNKSHSASTRLFIINAFKSFYRLCIDKDFNHKILPRPKGEQKQPDILSVEEIQKMISNSTNLKHKSIIALMYSCALRVGEATNLKVKDIDAKNNRIVIKNGKGKIDRIVMLDESLLRLLREYWGVYKTSEYLFEGATGGKYSDKSIQTLVKAAASKNKINKNISSHSLRHSCITQMIKDGVDLRTVQKIAGHKNINTTAGYIRIYDVDIINTVSPLSKISI